MGREGNGKGTEGRGREREGKGTERNGGERKGREGKGRGGKGREQACWGQRSIAPIHQGLLVYSHDAWPSGGRRPTLGATWNKVILLGGLNFVFSALYTAAVTAKNSDDNPDVSLVLFVVPLAVTLFIFISWVRPSSPPCSRPCASPTYSPVPLCVPCRRSPRWATRSPSWRCGVRPRRSRSTSPSVGSCPRPCSSCSSSRASRSSPTAVRVHLPPRGLDPERKRTYHECVRGPGDANS